jgi:catechol 2,3-dioxygenase-like lactoylglutathione lyase family enzyme
MIDHVSIGVRDIAAAKRFYDAALKPLGYMCLVEIEGTLGYGKAGPAFWVSAAEHPVPPDEKSGLHICFAAPTRGSADQSIRPRFATVGAITDRRACAATTAATITPPSWSTPTGTASRRIAAPPREPQGLGCGKGRSAFLTAAGSPAMTRR